LHPVLLCPNWLMRSCCPAGRRTEHSQGRTDSDTAGEGENAW
jgi:hypothetical protein